MLVILFLPAGAQNMYGPIHPEAWAEPNCQGGDTAITFTDNFYGRSLSIVLVSRSFKLSRALQGEEQLDISVTRNFDTWYADKDQFSMNDSSCQTLVQTYYAVNGSTACHNTPKFTCHRLWTNPGLSWSYTTE
ncbi:hypothetical protein ASPFODRAFT_54812 [Aspergillus luchuensis CBS 106.47]|uniref:Uncharacterized protein n=1 Tax=Aspergillus luchuensis (strain CBS 106.47) TaxID=1137211 RepID=A0A1M3SYX1_ASPLC|nr:hypothetical protein ASPFODRAFT_54812 [Aspergillus luchuensis CBS 106.47]